MHSQKLLCTISWIRSSGIRHCQRGNGPAKKLFRFYLKGAWQTFSGRFTTFLDESFAIFTESIIVSSTDCMGGPYEKELLKGLLTDYERYARLFTQLSKRPLQNFGFCWFHFSNSFDSRQNRPVLNESSPLVLTFGVTLQQIIDVVGGT